MRSANKKLKITILLILTIICSLLLLMGNLAGKIDPATCWIFAIAGLIFPFLFLLNVFLSLIWLFVKKNYAIIPFVVILISIPNVIATFPLHFYSSLPLQRETGSLRILTWNVGLMNYSAPDVQTAINKNKVIFDAIFEQNADVLCLQEFFTAVIPDKTYNFIDSISTHLHYPYYYFSRDYPKFEGKFYSGTIIFSRFPIIDTLKIPLGNKFHGSMVKTGIVKGKDTIDVFSSRLQNTGIEKINADEIINAENIPATDGLFSKLKYTYTQRSAQAKKIRDVINKSKRRILFTGDLNDIPVSYAYETIKGSMNDAWVKTGTGFGRTYRYFSPTLRIDQIFYDDSFKAIRSRRIITKASDHYGLVTDLQMR